MIVTEKACRPGQTTCLYCSQEVGTPHNVDVCVLIQKKIKLKISFEIEDEIPAHWEDENIDFFYQEGSMCHDSFIDRLLERQKERAETTGCMCGELEVEVLEVGDEVTMNPKRG